MSFTERMRMASIFPPFGSGGGKNDLINTFMTQMLPLIQQSRQQQGQGMSQQGLESISDRLTNRQERLGMQDPSRMDTVYKPPAGEITPLHKESFRLQEKAIDSRGDLANATLGIKQQDADTRLMRADIQAFQAANPNLKIVTQRGGNIVAIDPRTGEVKADLGSSGLLSDTDRIQQGSEADLARIRAGGEETRNTQQERFLQRIQELMEGGRQARETQGERPIPPNQERAGFLSKVERILNQKPEWRKFIQFDGDNVSIREAQEEGRMGAAKNFFGNRPDTATRLEIEQALYGEEEPAPNPPIQRPPPNRNIPPPATNAVPMKTPDGRTIFVPPNAVQEAITRGATLAGRQ